MPEAPCGAACQSGARRQMQEHLRPRPHLPIWRRATRVSTKLFVVSMLPMVQAACSDVCAGVTCEAWRDDSPMSCEDLVRVLNCGQCSSCCKNMPPPPPSTPPAPPRPPPLMPESPPRERALLRPRGWDPYTNKQTNKRGGRARTCAERTSPSASTHSLLDTPEWARKDSQPAPAATSSLEFSADASTAEGLAQARISQIVIQILPARAAVRKFPRNLPRNSYMCAAACGEPLLGPGR